MSAAVRPRRFRTRLSAAFLVVAGITSGLLALGSLLSIREYRYRTFTRNADNTARLGLLSAPDDLSRANFDILFDEFRARAGFETVALVGDSSFSSSPHLGAADVPAPLRAPAAPGTLRRGHTTVGRTPYLVIGGTPDGGAGDLFFFFDRRDVIESVRQAGDVLAIGWVLSVSTAALVGQLVARRTLRPVGEAAEAARSLANGLLETRLHSSTDDEFGAWAQSFNRMAAALEEKIDELSAAAEREKRFTADVAHDLRTPLASMSSAASLLADELDRMTPRARALSQLLIDDVRRLESLVLELLELARLDAGQDDVHLEVLSLQEAVRAVLQPWDGKAHVVAPIPPDVKVLADRGRFRRVVSNLVTNALQHAGSEVELVARPENGFVALDVLDRGPGLPAGDLERVFDRFYKTDSARTGAGSGLGLAIASEHARAQGGAVVASNRDGGGACFTLRLRAPSHPAAAEQVAGAGEAAP